MDQRDSGSTDQQKVTGMLSLDDGKSKTISDFFNHQGFPPFTNSDTSFQAADSIKGVAVSLRLKVFRYIERAPATCDEIEEGLGMRHQTASARIRDLAKLDILEDSGHRRKTRSGRLATVWQAKKT